MTFRDSDRRRALAALAAAGVLFGLTVPLSKVALVWLDPAWLAVGRFALAAPVLAILARASLRGALSRQVAAWGVLGYGAMLLLQNAGIERTSVTHAALIFGTVPALVAVASAASGRAVPEPAAWAGFAVAFCGIALVAGAGGDASLTGDALVLGAAALNAVFVVAQADLLRGRDPVGVTAVQLGAAGAACLPVALLAGGLPAAPAAAAAPLALAALAVLGTLLPFALYAYGQARVPAVVAGGFVNLEPVVGVALGLVAFGNLLAPVQLAGAVAVLAGLALSSAPPRVPWRGTLPSAAP